MSHPAFQRYLKSYDDTRHQQLATALRRDPSVDLDHPGAESAP